VTKILKAAALAVALSGVAMIGVSAAYAADVVVQFDPGVVQYGYTDGYWTRTHEWRSWERPEHVEIYRKHPNAAYYEYRHDRDPDMGWRVR
jgi:hypothetical protein